MECLQSSQSLKYVLLSGELPHRMCPCLTTAAAAKGCGWLLVSLEAAPQGPESQKTRAQEMQLTESEFSAGGTLTHYANSFSRRAFIIAGSARFRAAFRTNPISLFIALGFPFFISITT